MEEGVKEEEWRRKEGRRPAGERKARRWMVWWMRHFVFRERTPCPPMRCMRSDVGLSSSTPLGVTIDERTRLGPVRREGEAEGDAGQAEQLRLHAPLAPLVAGPQADRVIPGGRGGGVGVL